MKSSCFYDLMKKSMFHYLIISIKIYISIIMYNEKGVPPAIPQSFSIHTAAAYKLPLKPNIDYTLDRYSPVLVSILIVSP